MAKLILKDLDLKDKKVLMRVDFNVPQDKTGKITDDTRIQAAIPSIRYVLDHDAKLILMSHLGKPNGKKDPLYSLKNIASYLSNILKTPVLFAEDCVGAKTKEIVNQLKNGEVLLLENLRFHKEEEKPEENLEFAKKIAEFGDVFVNEAFGTSHRAHSSTVTVPKYFPKKAAAGFLVEKEIEAIANILTHPKKPFYAIIGGSKVSSKLGIIKTLLKKADAIFIGGAMAYTFLKAEGFSIGSSMYEKELLEEAKKILQTAKEQNVEIILPIDHVITKDLKGDDPVSIVSAKDGIPDGFYGVDIGPLTIQLFSEKLKNCKTALWNGPVGIFEILKFSEGTLAIAKVLSTLKATTIVGGGDSIAALNSSGLESKISHVSTGGGALLEFIEYETLPGIEVLTDK